jgi:hypothetical protein
VIRRVICGLATVLAVGCGDNREEPIPPDPPGPAPTVEPGEHQLPRLTEQQLERSIHDILGDEIVVPSRLEPDAPVEGMLAIGAARTTVSPLGAERIEAASYDIAAQAMTDSAARDQLMPCLPVDARDDDCARQAIAGLGRRLWRRPLTDGELDGLVDIAGAAGAELGDFHDGLEFAIAALLQSPNFLFRVELGEPDPDDPSRLRYTDYEMASRLSFFLWNTTPDDDLLDAAERGELITSEGLRAQVDRLLESPRARDAVRAFFTDIYRLYELDNLSKDPTIFTHMSPEVGPAAREETLSLIEDMIFDEQADYRALFTTRKTYLDRRLASIYGVRAPARDGFAPTRWDDGSPRAGVLTHISLLALNSHPVASSATLRGKFVRRTLLCGTIPPPPTDVDTSIPEPSGDAVTLRDRLAEHQEVEFCASCHKSMDPIGLGLENFDALGQYRTRENGELIDASGDLDGIPFEDARTLGEAIASHPDLGPCLVKNLYRYANARLETYAERDLIAYLAEVFEYYDYRVLDLMRELVLSDGFRYSTAAPTEAEGGA